MAATNIEKINLKKIVSYGLIITSIITTIGCILFIIFTTMPIAYYLIITFSLIIPAWVLFYLLKKDIKYLVFVQNATCYIMILFFSGVALFAGGLRSVSLTVLHIIPIIALIFEINILIPSLIIVLYISALTFAFFNPYLDAIFLGLNVFPENSLINPNMTYIINYYIVFFIIFLCVNYFKKQNEYYKTIITDRNNQLEQEKENKTRFFINAAHETKTPLTLIKNYLDDFIERKNLAKNEDLRIIRDNVLKLETDMLNFLDSEKIEQEEIVYRHNQIFNLSALLTDKLRLFVPVFRNKQLVLKKSIENEIHIQADSQAMDRVLNNLLDNAVKYSLRYGQIKVNLEKTDQKVRLCITNSGPGIVQEELDNIFKPYYQLNREKSNNQGMGMGLYIVKNIIQSLNGEIRIKSSPEQETSIEICLSEHQLKPEDTLATYELEKPINISQLNLDQKPVDLHLKSILIVEDDLNLLKIMHRHLKDQYNVFYAVNGQEALQILEQEKIDLIVSDIMMDIMDGYKFLNEITPDFHHIPFLFVTAKTTETDKIKGLNNGAVDYIYKPFSMQELKLKIKNHLTEQTQTEDLILQSITYHLQNYKKAKPDHLFEDLCRQYRITKSEKKIILMLKNGLENKEIAKNLNLSIFTVGNHVRNIYSKLAVTNRVELLQKLKIF